MYQLSISANGENCMTYFLPYGDAAEMAMHFVDTADKIRIDKDNSPILSIDMEAVTPDFALQILQQKVSKIMKIQTLKLSDLNIPTIHPMRPNTTDAVQWLVDDIKLHGQMDAINVVPANKGYDITDGILRVWALEKLGITEVKARVYSRVQRRYRSRLHDDEEDVSPGELPVKAMGIDPRNDEPFEQD